VTRNLGAVLTETGELDAALDAFRWRIDNAPRWCYRTCC